jgi:hypothetical protein
MNCKQVRGYLLHAERPAQPGAAVETHLVACRQCSQWHQRLLELERAIPELPVPRSSGPGEVLARLAAEPLPAGKRAVLSGERGSALRRWFESPALGPAGLAASLLLFAFIWWMLQGKRDQALVQEGPPARRAPAPDQLLANLMQRNLRLAQAKTNRDRVEALTDLAVDLHRETGALATAGDGEDLTALAQMYSRVVREGVLERARLLDQKDRAQVLAPLADQLADMEKQAERMATGGLPTASADTLRAMAEAAREGTQKLRSLAREEQR